MESNAELPGEREKISRRSFIAASFLGVSLGTVAVSGLGNKKSTEQKERYTSTQAPFIRRSADKNGIVRYEQGKQAISILSTLHWKQVDPLLILKDVDCLSYDTAGATHVLGGAHVGHFFSEDAPEHYKPLVEPIIKQGIELQLICPPAPFVNDEDTSIPQAVDYGILASQSAIGTLLIRDAGSELLQDLKAHRIEELRQGSIGDIAAWNVLKGGAGMILSEPLLASLSRFADVGLDAQTESWLRSVCMRHPGFLPLMNQYVDLIHTIKLRLLMADRAALDPELSQHFQLVIGRTHVGVASNLERPMDDLLADFGSPETQAILRIASAPNVRSLVTSTGTRFTKKPNSINSKGWELHRESNEVFYPELFESLPPRAREVLFSLYPPQYFLEHRFVGTPSGYTPDVDSLLARR